jgi:hypothetical protein
LVEAIGINLWSSPGLCDTYKAKTADALYAHNFSLRGLICLVTDKRLHKRFSTDYFNAAAFSWRASFSSNVAPPRFLFLSGVIRSELLHNNPKLQTINL